jgi:DNA polymerase (family 10)
MTLDNDHIADLFERLADLLEFQGANAFRIRAYRNSSRAIRNQSVSIAQLAIDDPQQLTGIDGIGKGVAEKCVELVETGTLAQLESLLEEIPESVLTLLRIPGLGPRKAALLYQELNISTLDQLQEACRAERVRGLKGFGPKTEQLILRGIQLAKAAGERIYWAEADQIVRALREHLGSCKSIDRLEFAGSYRRGKETVGDLDILVVSTDADSVMDHLQDFPVVEDTIARGSTKMSIRLDTGLQVDLRVVPADSFGAALQYFTGSKEHNVVLRGRAKRQGFKINEYGLYRTEKDSESYVAGRHEEDIYQTLGLPWIVPELREARHEFDWADADQLPELVQISDIQGDLHAHTTATDGLCSLSEMVEAARERGLCYLAITDHSQRVTMAHGLDADRLLAQWQSIDQLNQELNGEFRVLKGIECDILEKGGLDLSDEVLAQADWVVASVHYGQRQTREQITGRIVEALANPHVDVIAHPTGRLINRREAYQVDMEKVLEVAQQHGKMMELNANPARLDLNDVNAAAAKQLGVPIVISTDAHSREGLDVMRFGVLQARRAGLTRQDVANTRSWEKVHELLEK